MVTKKVQPNLRNREQFKCLTNTFVSSNFSINTQYKTNQSDFTTDLKKFDMRNQFLEIMKYKNI